MVKKGQRVIIRLECSVCKERNYTTTKNRENTKEKLVLKKYCRKCRRHTEHREVKS